jgi:hypothetical protein
MVVQVAALITQLRLLAVLATHLAHLHHKAITVEMAHHLRVAQTMVVVVVAQEQPGALQAAQLPATAAMALPLVLVVLQ